MNELIKIELRGASELAENFRDLRKYMKGQPLRRAVRVAAQSMRDQIANNARQKTGRLKNNLLVKTRLLFKGREPETISARVVVKDGGKGDKSGSFYWRFLELGFTTRSGSVVKYPFIEPVVQRKRKEAAQAVIDEVQKAIDRAEKRQKKIARKKDGR
jgi:HK97 gp10 family phage protein